MKIRNYKRGDEKEIMKIYQKAFAGFPWFENLSNEEVKRRWNKHRAKRGFRCLVAEEKNRIIGATWWEAPTLEEIRLERGDRLADFIKKKEIKFIIWIRETCVDPVLHGRGIGKMLKNRALEEIKCSKLHCIILTRLRDDNSSIIYLNSSLGFERTGIKMPSSQKKGTFHEYWYLEVGKNNKFVISEDIYVLLQKWARERNFSLPTNKFFRKLRVEMQDFLEGIFGKNKIDMVSEKELTRGMKNLVSRTGLYPISIDKAYFPTQPSLEINRIINRDLVKQGADARFGFVHVWEQIKKLSRYCPREIVLIDDVIFSGATLGNAVDIFARYNIEVKLIIAGVVIGNGFKAFHQKGLKVEFVHFYSEVIDEICERDFYPGIPLSGRLVSGTKFETGAPYLLPFGKPHEWASISREKEKEFSVFCLRQTIKLWKAIEKASGKIVRCCDLERVPLGISYNKKQFVNELRRVLKLI